MGMSWDEWLDRSNWELAGVTDQELRILQEYLKGQLSPFEAARGIMSLIDDTITSETHEDDKGERITWFLIDTGIELTDHIGAIVTLVSAIRELPEIEMTPAQREKYPQWKKWRDQEKWWEFGYWERSNRAEEGRYEQDDDKAATTTGPGFWISMMMFHAHECVQWHDPYQALQGYGFPYIIEALEQDPWNHVPAGESTRPKHRRRPGRSISMLNSAIPAIAPWFRIAGRVVYNYEDNEFSSVLYDRNPGEYKWWDSNLWHGPLGYSKERWNFWANRLRWIAGQEVLVENTRKIARETADEMESIAKDPQSQTYRNWIKPLHPKDLSYGGDGEVDVYLR